MPTKIDRAQVQRLVAEGAQLVEVLPREEYAEAHLPGAINLPLKKLDRKTAAQLERERPVITYCYDFQCDLGPRAAARLESLGFTQVFEYSAGKVDWSAAGLPMDGQRAYIPKAIDVVQHEVPTCHPTELVEAVWERVQSMGWKMCVVVNDQRVVLGRLRGVGWETNPQATAEAIMENGPTTFRPDVPLEELVRRMGEKKVGSVLITNSEGMLLGVLFKQAAEHYLRESQSEKEVAYSGNGASF